MSWSGPRLLATGWSLHLPGLTSTAVHTGLPPGPGDRVVADLSPPEQLAAQLGRKGLRYLEPATRLAVGAVHRALGLPAGQRADWPMSPSTAVVACSNLGNVGTVARVARTVAREGGRAVSVMDAPNVSSNVMASAVARWFRFGGPNLMVCSGTTAGLDGLRLAALLLRAGRADRVVLVGAEPADEVACELSAASHPVRRLHAAAACVLLRPWQPAGPREVEVEVLPRAGAWPRVPRVTIGRDGFDPATHWGDCYGALGVVALALAAHLAADEQHRVVGVHCDGEDGERAVLVSSSGSGTAGRHR